MDRYCPECHSNMTPSLVGYLCVNCGHAQRFYSNTEAAMANPVIPVENPAADAPISANSEPKIESIKGKRQIKSTLKRLMVPELPEPHHHEIIKHESTEHVHHSTTPIETIKTAASDTKSESVNYQKPPNEASNLEDLQVALHPKQHDTSLWVLITVAILILTFATILLLVILFK